MLSAVHTVDRRLSSHTSSHTRRPSQTNSPYRFDMGAKGDCYSNVQLTVSPHYGAVKQADADALANEWGLSQTEKARIQTMMEGAGVIFADKPDDYAGCYWIEASITATC